MENVDIGISAVVVCGVVLEGVDLAYLSASSVCLSGNPWLGWGGDCESCASSLAQFGTRNAELNQPESELKAFTSQHARLKIQLITPGGGGSTWPIVCKTSHVPPANTTTVAAAHFRIPHTKETRRNTFLQWDTHVTPQRIKITLVNEDWKQC